MLSLQLTPFTELRTPRLLLRELREADAPTLFIMRSDARFIRYLDRDPDASVDETLAIIRRIAQNTADNAGITWAIVRPDRPDELLGTVGLWRMMPEKHRAEIGYGLHSDHWGQGLMHEALAAVLDYGFQSLHLHSVEANVNPSNAASIRALEKQGFVREAHFREDYYFRGQFLDSVIYSLLTPLRPGSPA
ncbi:GNAT family N-acetyltransferase [Hymenobacter persicinus]|nr:GNAT family N-acetyltransferase [Hymenobacter persicinus]